MHLHRKDPQVRSGVGGIGRQPIGNDGQLSTGIRADQFPGSAVATFDLVANLAYMRTATNSGGVVVDPPTVGQAVWFHFDFSIPGTGGPVDVPVRAQIDGVDKCAGTLSGLDVGFAYTINCSTSWIATAGPHVLVWTLDHTGTVEETNESNNAATKNFTPTGTGMDLVAQIAYLRTATAGGGSIVDPGTVGQSLFFHLEWLFNGTGAATSVSFRARLDGVDHCTGSASVAPPSTNTAFCNNAWVATSGTHTLQWDLDYTGTVGENSEANNSATKSFAPGTGNAGMLITPTFDGPVSTAERALIMNAISFYERTFTDPITVTIRFQRMNTGLGQSQTTLYGIPYSDFRAALFADKNPSSADDTLAFAGGRLPVLATNPADGTSSIFVKTANLRAAGVAGSFPPDLSSGFDGIVSFNNTNVDLNGGLFSLMATIQHEINEVLSMGSSLPSFPIPLSSSMPLDLFRYASGANVRSFASNPDTNNPCVSTPQAFFSIDGTAHINEFNNCNNTGDYGDWITHTPSQVNDAFTNGTGNLVMTSTNSEARALDVTGYNIISVTPPAPKHRRGQTTAD